jgi:hypothetical protein
MYFYLRLHNRKEYCPVTNISVIVGGLEVAGNPIQESAVPGK